MSTELSSIGITRDRMDLILDRVRSLSKDSYGDLNIEDSTPDGQIIGILSEVLSKLHEQNQALVDMFDPNASSSDSLSSLVRMNGIVREPKTPTNTILTISIADGGTPQVLPAPIFINSAGGGDQYVIPFDIYSIPATNIEVYAEAVEFNTDILPENTLTIVETVVTYPITIISHPITVLGKEEESDSKLRARRESHSSSGGSSSNEVLYTKLKALSGTLDITIDAQEGYTEPSNVDPHSTVFIVAPIRGISVEDETLWKLEIGKLMLTHLTIGVRTRATSLGFYEQELTPQTDQGFPQSMWVHNAELRPIHIIVNVTELDGFPSSGAEDIKQSIIDFTREQGTSMYGIKARIYQNELTPPCYRVAGMVVDDLFIGFSTNPTGQANMQLLPTDIPNFDIATITVNVS